MGHRNSSSKNVVGLPWRRPLAMNWRKRTRETGTGDWGPKMMLDLRMMWFAQRSCMNMNAAGGTAAYMLYICSSQLITSTKKEYGDYHLLCPRLAKYTQNLSRQQPTGVKKFPRTLNQSSNTTKQAVARGSQPQSCKLTKHGSVKCRGYIRHHPVNSSDHLYHYPSRRQGNISTQEEPLCLEALWKTGSYLD